MPEVIINITNIISTVFLLLTLIIIAIFKISKSKHSELNIFFILSVCLLLTVAIFNLFEHFSIMVSIDFYEDSVELLFIPFIIFSLNASNLTFEYQLRSKAELFSSKIISTSPAVTFNYNLNRDNITFIDVIDRKLAEQKVYKYQNHLENLAKNRTIVLESSKTELITISDQLHKANLGLRKINVIVKNQSEKLSLLGILMAGIAHEINNPLNYICNSIVELKLSLCSIKNFTNEFLMEPVGKYSLNSDLNTMKLIKKHDIVENNNIVTTISGYIQTGIDRTISE